MYESFRTFYPDLPIVIVDGSPKKDPCYKYINSLKGGKNTIYQLEKNIGHGPGLHYAINRIDDEQLLIMDSDIEILSDPLPAVSELLKDNVYAVGEIDMVGSNGLRSNPIRNIPFVQPYFMLMSRRQYFNYHRFIHHGTPSYKAMVQIWQQGLSNKVLQRFPVAEYVHHHWGGTRGVNKKNCLVEIPGQWER
jgi:hypothetical protein